MVPIYDTDIAEERWAQAEWQQYELWEKVELRIRRNKRLWILGTGVLFVLLFSLPIISDRRPKWATLSLARVLGREVNLLKKEASLAHQAHRIRFLPGVTLPYVVEKGAKCDQGMAEVRRGELNSATHGSVELIFGVDADQAGVPGLVQSYCYDPLAGTDASSTGEALVGFGLIPAKDWAEKRFDRLSVLLLSGPSGQMTFE